VQNLQKPSALQLLINFSWKVNRPTPSRPPAFIFIFISFILVEGAGNICAHCDAGWDITRIADGFDNFGLWKQQAAEGTRSEEQPDEQYQKRFGLTKHAFDWLLR
jgi:hypothetical protein